MLKHGWAQPSRSLRSNIRWMFGINRTSVHLYFLLTWKTENWEKRRRIFLFLEKMTLSWTCATFVLLFVARCETRYFALFWLDFYCIYYCLPQFQGQPQHLKYQNWIKKLLSRVSILTPDIDIANRPSVCLSIRHVPVSYENGLTYCHTYFSPYGSPIIPLLPASNIFTRFRPGHPLRGH